MLKKILIGVVAVLVVLAAVIATRPDTFTIHRAITIAAPPQIPFTLVNDFHAWAGWSPWEKLDPAMKKTFNGPPAGPGAQYAWVGNDKVGEGRMTIASSKASDEIEIKLEFLKPWEATSQTLFSFKPAGAGTEVLWTMNGHNNFMAKAMCLFMDMDKMIGPDFERGLGQMKTSAEAEAMRQAEAARKEAEAAAAAAREKAAADATAPAAPAQP